MKIVVLSDTHMPKRAKSLPERLVMELKEADLILHAGDWQTKEVYEMLSTYAPVEGVFGNVDGEEMKQLVHEKQIVQAEGYSIGIVHGHGTKQTTEKRAIAAFEKEKVDIIIFGHSHIPVLKQVENTILFNPGSPTDKRRQNQYSFGIITIQEELLIQHVFFDQKT
jgi:uncharacterized protein